MQSRFPFDNVPGIIEERGSTVVGGGARSRYMYVDYLNGQERVCAFLQVTSRTDVEGGWSPREEVREASQIRRFRPR